ncbi:MULTISPECIES: DUF3828 domain-containing protein [unclassified Duganella]|uniref:DUF3828 domain-containing protein n=1 Tax=unclassified Duganella TaxID=2636909 RepID=UPI000E34AF08|nr:MULTISPECIES: DUF3828 domain-containing protein [unclassified Duganella]RFP08204.1 DUF3828 domain-containing protein [Duganella sp. BJB475]RFP22474.1 DUF3828 domain-containing protein [Duganella sp. BJB476]
MKINKAHILPFASLLVATVFAIASLLAYKAQFEAGQLTFITNFYTSYLSNPGRRTPPPAGSFYSEELETLLATNHRLCAQLAHGDEICGYDADGDIFLDTQETAPDLDFNKARFKAIRSGKRTVDVSFNVFPSEGKNYDRQIRYVLKMEDDGWRVDDMLVGSNGTFDIANAMRREIQHENEELLARERTSSEAAMKAGALH